MKTFNKGDKVQDIYSKDVFIVKNCYIQDYAGKPDTTVTFEPGYHFGIWQETPWNKGSNLIKLS